MLVVLLHYGLELTLQVGRMLRVCVVYIIIGIGKACIVLLVIAVANACCTAPQLLRLKFTEELYLEECHLYISFQLIVELIFHFLRFLGTLDERGQEMVGEILCGCLGLLGLSGNILEIDLGNFEDLLLIDLQLSDVKADWHACQFYLQLPFCQRAGE